MTCCSGILLDRSCEKLVSRPKFNSSTASPAVVSESRSGCNLQATWQSKKGTTNNENQDRALVDPELGLFVVADGLGGYEGGATASAIAVSCINEFFRTELPKFSDLQALVLSSIDYANSAIRTLAVERDNMRQMATTVVVAAVRHVELIIANVGDSRAYLLKYGRLKKVTRDHSAAADLTGKRLFSGKQSRIRTSRNILTMALGSSSNVRPAVFRSTVNDFDQLLLCTDGLWSVLEDDVIERTLAEDGNLLEKCRNLVSLAERNGATDDITCVLIDISR